MDIELKFINRSNDVADSQVMIFQKNLAADDPIVAWRVIENCGPGEYHPFTYSMDLGVTSTDRWGNYTPMLPAREGQLYEVKRDMSGEALALAGPASSPAEIQVVNALPDGVVGAHLYRGKHLVALKTNLAPGQKAVFQFKPTLWIGLASQVEQGDRLNSAALADINTELSLLGVASADIVMTGGGAGPAATAFEFRLENVVMA
jgi:hypothetical protein